MRGPMLSGASQLIDRLALDAVVTVGANGVSGTSSTSVTLIVTLTASVPPLPSLTLTATE